MGFEMSLLRMLAFRPAEGSVSAAATAPVAVTKQATAAARPSAPPPSEATSVAMPSAAPAASISDLPPAEPVSAGPARLAGNDDWLLLSKTLNLRGPEREIGLHAAFVSFQDSVLKLEYPENLFDTLNDIMLSRVQTAIGRHCNSLCRSRSTGRRTRRPKPCSPAKHRRGSEKRRRPTPNSRIDPVVAALLQEGGQIVPDSINP